MAARISRPTRSAMQSGTAKAVQWLLEFEPETRQAIEPLMGWTSSAETRRQVRLAFATKEEAIAYCDANGLAWSLLEPKEPKRRKIAYADNFRHDRVGAWTH